MANTKCRSCDRAADAGAYYSSSAANIMAKALNPFLVGRGINSPGRSCPGLRSHPLNNVSSGKPLAGPACPERRPKDARNIAACAIR